MALNKITKFTDDRGTLIALDSLDTIPFEIKRVFFMYDMPIGSTRGNHAHHTANQYVVCISGSFKLIINDASGEKNYYLNDPSIGVFIPNMSWTRLTEFTSSTIVMVFTDTSYDEQDYIRSFKYFNKLIMEIGHLGAFKS